MPDDTRKLLWKADELQSQERAVTQRLNPNSHLLRTGLSRLAGLQRAHVSLGRVPPGKDSFAYHSHMVEEEWVYILSGRGLADIDGQQYEVGPGDFMGFPSPGIAHLLLVCRIRMNRSLIGDKRGRCKLQPDWRPTVRMLSLRAMIA